MPKGNGFQVYFHLKDVCYVFLFIPTKKFIITNYQIQVNWNIIMVIGAVSTIYEIFFLKNFDLPYDLIAIYLLIFLIIKVIFPDFIKKLVIY